jgi:hypothetical protein
MIAWFVALAAAADLVIAPVDGELRPGAPVRVHLALTDDSGAAVSGVPRLFARGGAVSLDGPVAPGVWAAWVTPAPDVEEVRVDALFGAVGAAASLAVRPLPPSTLRLPTRPDAVPADAREVTLRVTGASLPPPEGLVVAVGEGRVLGVAVTDGALDVRLALEDSPYPRVVPVGLYDATRDEAPLWTQIRVRTRPRFSLQTEPGTTLTLAVGARTYGPFVADAHGVVTAVVDQYPGELAANAVFTDDLGNETRTALPLSAHTQPVLVALVGAPGLPGQSTSKVFLHAVHGDGHAWVGGSPACKTSDRTDLPVVSVGEGAWSVMTAPTSAEGPADPRLLCRLGTGLEVRPRLSAGVGAPATLRLRVWPEELSTDFPVADVHVVLEDGLGDRLSPDGVEVVAERGLVTPVPGDASALRFEYQGRLAASAGQDVLTARYRAPPGGPDVRRLVVRHGPVTGDELTVGARALDGAGRPVVGVPLVFDVDGAPARAVTDSDGWGRAVAPLTPGSRAVVVRASSGGRVARAVAPRGSAASAGLDEPDLVVRKLLSFSSGTVSEVSVAVDPPVLYTGPGAFAVVTVTLRDRAGALVVDDDVDVDVSASEGTVGDVRRQSDGSLRVEFEPPTGDRAREVVLTARAGGATGTTRLLVEPRPLIRAPSLSFGGITNLGAVTSPYLSADFDLRVPVLGTSAILRFGVGTWGASAEAETGFGPKLRARMTVAPLQVGLIARRDLRGAAVWVGLGGLFSPYRSVSRIGDDVAARVTGFLPPGLALTGGVGQRIGGGEVMLELRGLALASPGGAATLQGGVGGVGVLIGYRLID